MTMSSALTAAFFFFFFFSAEALGYTKAIRPFLNKRLRPIDILHGVSFASAASGYDELTANLSVSLLEPSPSS